MRKVTPHLKKQKEGGLFEEGEDEEGYTPYVEDEETEDGKVGEDEEGYTPFEEKEEIGEGGLFEDGEDEGFEEKEESEEYGSDDDDTVQGALGDNGDFDDNEVALPLGQEKEEKEEEED